jgi:hypothetical protein
MPCATARWDWDWNGLDGGAGGRLQESAELAGVQCVVEEEEVGVVPPPPHPARTSADVTVAAMRESLFIGRLYLLERACIV